jgi:hypothetical protein
MLFDLRARGRRRTIQVIYLFLALLMGGGLIFFGIGGNTSGGLFDAFKDGGNTSNDSALTKKVDSAEKRVQANRTNPALWAALTRAQYQVAGLGENYDQNTGTFTPKGKAALRNVERSWDQYMALDPPKPNPDLASLMVQAFSPTGLNRPAKAVTAQEIVIDSRPPSTGLYSTLAILAYGANQSRKGDLAAAKAVDLAPKDQRATVREQLKQAKQQAVAGSAQQSQSSG